MSQNIIIKIFIKVKIVPTKKKYYTTRDFTEEKVQKLYSNFENNLIDKYLKIVMKYYINFQLFKEGFFDEIHNVSLYKKK